MRVIALTLKNQSLLLRAPQSVVLWLIRDLLQSARLNWTAAVIFDFCRNYNGLLFVRAFVYVYGINSTWTEN